MFLFWTLSTTYSREESLSSAVRCQIKRGDYCDGGVPEELADNHAVLDFFLPILRADFQLLETYQCDEVVPAACPISIFMVLVICLLCCLI